MNEKMKERAVDAKATEHNATSAPMLVSASRSAQGRRDHATLSAVGAALKLIVHSRTFTYDLLAAYEAQQQEIKRLKNAFEASVDMVEEGWEMVKDCQAEAATLRAKLVTALEGDRDALLGLRGEPIPDAPTVTVASAVDVPNHHAVALGRLGGQAKSAQKAKASAANGKKGGRPAKGKKR